VTRARRKREGPRSGAFATSSKGQSIRIAEDASLQQRITDNLGTRAFKEIARQRLINGPAKPEIPIGLQIQEDMLLADTAEETKSPVTPARARTYKVRSGDTLSAIARKTGTTITQLKNWNRLRTTNLKVGTQLLIQSPGATATQH